METIFCPLCGYPANKTGDALLDQSGHDRTKQGIPAGVYTCTKEDHHVTTQRLKPRE